MLSPMKILFFVIDILLFLLGIVVLAIGTWVLKDYRIITPQFGITSTYWLHKSAYFIIGFGFILILFASIGLCAAVTKNTIFLGFFSICCFLPLLIVICALGIAWYIFSGTRIKPFLEEHLRSYWPSSDGFRNMEISLMCCGIKGPRDYNDSVPNSCIDPRDRKFHRSKAKMTMIDSKLIDNISLLTNSPNIGTFLRDGVNIITPITDKDNVTLITAMLCNTSSQVLTDVYFINYTTTNIPNVTTLNSSENNYIFVDVNSGADQSEINKNDTELPKKLHYDEVVLNIFNPIHSDLQFIELREKIYTTAKSLVFYQTGCLDRVKEMLTITTGVLSGLYITVVILMLSTFIIALSLQKGSRAIRETV